jgi:hypothetical protein
MSCSIATLSKAEQLGKIATRESRPTTYFFLVVRLASSNLLHLHCDHAISKCKHGSSYSPVRLAIPARVTSVLASLTEPLTAGRSFSGHSDYIVMLRVPLLFPGSPSAHLNPALVAHGQVGLNLCPERE